MLDYRRAHHPGGIYFFTVNILQRTRDDLHTRHIDLLLDAVRSVLREPAICFLRVSPQDAFSLEDVSDLFGLCHKVTPRKPKLYDPVNVTEFRTALFG